MTPFSALGSVDPTRNHPLLPKNAQGQPIPTSVQDLKHCIQFIREQLGESYGSQNLALIVSELFKHVDPLAIGALEQAYSLARLITRKVLKTHRTPLDDEQIERIVETLSGQYFSHSYLISRAEVETDLKLPLVKPDEDVSRTIQALSEHFSSQFRKRAPIKLPGAQAEGFAAVILQTTECRWAVPMALSGDNLVLDQWFKLT